MKTRSTPERGASAGGFLVGGTVRYIGAAMEFGEKLVRRLLACALPLVMLAPPAIAQTTPPAAATATPTVAPAPAAPTATAAAVATTPAAPVVASPALEARAKNVAEIFSGRGDYDAIFAPTFREKVPRAQLDAVIAQITGGAGAVVGVEKLDAVTSTSGTLQIGFTRGIGTMRIAIDPAEPHQIVGLLVTGMTAREASLDAVLGTIASLPGTTGFAFVRLDGPAPTTILARQPDQAFAIGSAFKLVILSELVRALTAGERHWEDVVTLDGGPLPGGFYTDKPEGTKVTLRELAGRMISVSDNSATDILLATLGREKVEAMLPVVGFAAPARDRPFLTTLEAFKLKGVRGGALGTSYLALDEKGRRAMLDGEVHSTPISAIDPTLFADGKPRAIDTLEWFATPQDIVHVMNWLRLNTESGPASEARAILAQNSGVGPTAAQAWRYLGYKGGSEPGVMNMSFLLKTFDGTWYAMTGSWNDPSAAVDEGRFVALMARAVELAAAR